MALVNKTLTSYDPRMLERSKQGHEEVTTERTSLDHVTYDPQSHDIFGDLNPTQSTPPAKIYRIWVEYNNPHQVSSANTDTWGRTDRKTTEVKIPVSDVRTIFTAMQSAYIDNQGNNRLSSTQAAKVMWYLLSKEVSSLEGRTLSVREYRFLEDKRHAYIPRTFKNNIMTKRGKEHRVGKPHTARSVAAELFSRNKVMLDDLLN